MGNAIADFNYHYEPNANRLKNIVTGDTEIRRYDYDKTGRMTYENKNGSESFTAYDVSGKVTGVYKQKDVNGDLNLPVVTFGYDDRGFRLFKTTYNADGTAKTKTTWYVRDATGNIAGTYEENHETQTGPSLVEVPVYGSGRIGMHKPAYGQTFYEVTDNLGNVRAVIGGSVQTTMLATMENERKEKENNDFFGMHSTVTATDINHTASMVTVEGQTDLVEPNEVIRLNNRPNGRYNPNPVGGGTMLWVHPGDTVRAEVFAKYARIEESRNKSQFLALAGMLKNLSPIDNAVEMRKAFQMLSRSDFRALPVWGKLDDAQPPAFLNGLMFDKNMKLQSFDFDQVSEQARIKTIEDKTGHEKLELEFVAEKEGYLYIYISNESKENLDVYFDDLKVTHVYGAVVAGGDYYPYGLAIADRQITLEEYRFGYQGQYSEHDEETGYNFFELRNYDPIVGRWISPDPVRQYWSPYVGMGNNPLNEVDPSGGSSSSPIFGKDDTFLGVDSEGYTGQIITMDEALYNQLTNNGEIVLQHDFVTSLADNGVFANYLPNSNLNLGGYASIYNHVLNQMKDQDFSNLYNRSVSIYQYKSEGINNPEPTHRYEADPTNMRVSINEVYTSELTSVEIIQSYLGVHEWQGHNIMKYNNGWDHYKVYEMQRKHPTYLGLPKNLKKEINTRMESSYR